MLYSRAESPQSSEARQPLLPKESLIAPALPRIGVNITKFATDNALTLGLMAYLMYKALHDPIGNRLKATGVDTLNHYFGSDNLNTTIAALCEAFISNASSTDKALCPEYLQLGLPWLLPKATSTIESMPLDLLDPYIKKLSTYLFVACVATAIVTSIINPTTGVAKKKALTYLARRPEANQPQNVTAEASMSFGIGRIDM